MTQDLDRARERREPIATLVGESPWQGQDHAARCDAVRVLAAEAGSLPQKSKELFAEHLLPLYTDQRWLELPLARRREWIESDRRYLEHLVPVGAAEDSGLIRFIRQGSLPLVEREVASTLEQGAAAVAVSVSAVQGRRAALVVQSGEIAEHDGVAAPRWWKRVARDRTRTDVLLVVRSRESGDEVRIGANRRLNDGDAVFTFTVKDLKSLAGVLDLYLEAPSTGGRAVRIRTTRRGPLGTADVSPWSFYTTVKGNLSLKQ